MSDISDDLLDGIRELLESVSEHSGMNGAYCFQQDPLPASKDCCDGCLARWLLQELDKEQGNE